MFRGTSPGERSFVGDRVQHGYEVFTSPLQ